MISDLRTVVTRRNGAPWPYFVVFRVWGLIEKHVVLGLHSEPHIWKLHTCQWGDINISFKISF